MINNCSSLKRLDSPSRSTPPVLEVCVCFVYTTVSLGGMSVACTETTLKLVADFFVFALHTETNKINLFIIKSVYKNVVFLVCFICWHTCHLDWWVANYRRALHLSMHRMPLNSLMTAMTEPRKREQRPARTTFHQGLCKYNENIS